MTTLPAGTRLGRYEIRSALGAGGMGQAYLAEDTELGRRVALKVLPSDMKADEAIAIAADVADALADAHAHGVVHRDIKPSNVMLTARGQAVVVDFGLAKAGSGSEGARDDAATASVLSTPGAVLGTVPYMSPEQVRGEPLDGRSDIFSLGVMLYELLSGQRPFADKSAGDWTTSSRGRTSMRAASRSSGRARAPRSA